MVAVLGVAILAVTEQPRQAVVVGRTALSPSVEAVDCAAPGRRDRGVGHMTTGTVASLLEWDPSRTHKQVHWHVVDVPGQKTDSSLENKIVAYRNDRTADCAVVTMDEAVHSRCRRTSRVSVSRREELGRKVVGVDQRVMQVWLDIRRRAVAIQRMNWMLQGWLEARE